MRCTSSIRTSPDEANLAGAREGHLAELLGAAGLHDVEESDLTVRVEHASFEEWWEPYTLGVGPAGDYVASLDPERLSRAARALPREAPARPVHGRRSRLGSASPRLARSCAATGSRERPASGIFARPEIRR